MMVIILKYLFIIETPLLFYDEVCSYVLINGCLLCLKGQGNIYFIFMTYNANIF